MSHRNYDTEAKDQPEHMYAYDFDYLMHRYMLDEFEPFFSAGRTLELGCFEGHFTRLLTDKFSFLDVVEASTECIAVASAKANSKVNFIHSTFEVFSPVHKYKNIFLIHTLEHLDDPIGILKRIGNWLEDGGRLFVVVPNAHAASRQIAVAMGLIEHSAAVTKAEAAHGHRITYSFDTLNRDVKAAGLAPISTGGIFFKGLANFQLDAALKHGVIDKAYLDGCITLGRMYPDLCSSIFNICEFHHPGMK